MTSAGDPELEDAHLEIAELIEQITDQYQQLLRVGASPPNMIKNSERS
jgi:hypothetical protein